VSERQNQSLSSVINFGGAAIALYYLTGEPAWSWLLFFLPSGIANFFLYISAVRKEIGK
jgi:hypothetical protein